LDPIRNDVAGPMDLGLKGPNVILTFKDMELAAKHRKDNYMANLLGLKR
jgi:hypothetical protein